MHATDRRAQHDRLKKICGSFLLKLRFISHYQFLFGDQTMQMYGAYSSALFGTSSSALFGLVI